ncbi:serine/threonine protein kinase [Haloferula helveola]|uniref:Serine/threonine protein kinase n=1 Tax=Haloferula helveola TaxID=490095 RepID=A0ABM7RFT8_9BACT|nr:serine/threonine protein kinase [Haloferula helveola]
MRKGQSSLCRLAAGLSLLSPLCLAEDTSWTGWRGDDRSARLPDFKVPDPWPDSPESVWTTEVGTGYSTPLIIDDRVFQHARKGADEVLWCLDRDTGKPVWRKSWPVRFTPGRGGERHGPGPKSTPSFADGRVFTLSIDGTLRAWSAADGKPLWKRDFREHFDEAHPYWGTATSPIVDGDRLFAHTGSCEDGALFCLDPKTGKDLWVRTEEANCYSSPLVETIDGVRQLVEFNHDGLCGIDVSTGELLWKHNFPHRGNNQNTPTPIRFENTFIVGGENRGMFAIRVSRTDDAWSAEEVWQHRDTSLDMSSPVLGNGQVFGFSHFKTGQMFSLDPESGEVIWLGDPRAGENGQFLAIPGHVLALTDDGRLRILKNGDPKQKPSVVRTYRLADGDTWTAPALVGRDLLIKAGEKLTLWRFPSGL